MPITFIEGVRGEMSELHRRDRSRRFHALSVAVREHEAQARRLGAPSAADEALYAKLRLLSRPPGLRDRRSA